MNQEFVKKTLFLLGIVFLIALVINSKDVFISRIEFIQWEYIFISIVLLVILNLISAYLYVQVVKKYQPNLPSVKVVPVFIYNQITKYIPGKVWALLHQASSFQKELSFKHIFIINIEHTLAILIVISAVSALLLTYSFLSIAFSLMIALLSAIALGYLILKKCYTGQLINKFVGLFSKDSKLSQCRESITMVNVINFCVLYGGVYFLVNTLMVYSIFDLSFEQTATIIAFLGLSWVVGILFFIVPGGIGVREFVFIVLGNYSNLELSLTELSAIVVFIRLLLIFQELLLVAGMYVLHKKLHRF